MKELQRIIKILGTRCEEGIIEFIKSGLMKIINEFIGRII